MAKFKPRLYKPVKNLPLALTPPSNLALKFLAKEGTLSITLGLNSLIAMGIFFKVAAPVLPEGTVPMQAPKDIIQ